MSCLDYRARTNQLHKYQHSVPPGIVPRDVEIHEAVVAG